MRKISHYFGIKTLPPDRYLGLGLIAFHLCLILQVTGRHDQLILAALFWWAIALSIHPVPPSLISARTRLHQLHHYLGAFILVTVVLLGSLVLPYWLTSDSWVRIIPCLIFLSWTLIQSGAAWYRYGPEWRLVLVLMIPQGLVSHLAEPILGLSLQQLLTQISHFLLHYIGLETSRQGLEITLAQGRISVEYACAGVPLLVLLIQLVMLLTHRASLSLRQWLLLLGASTTIFLSVTSVRIALMAYVVNQQTLFNYLHSISGSEFFSTLAIVLIFTAYQTIIAKPDTSTIEE